MDLIRDPEIKLIPDRGSWGQKAPDSQHRVYTCYTERIKTMREGWKTCDSLKGGGLYPMRRQQKCGSLSPLFPLWMMLTAHAQALDNDKLCIGIGREQPTPPPPSSLGMGMKRRGRGEAATFIIWNIFSLCWWQPCCKAWLIAITKRGYMERLFLRPLIS